MGKQMRRKMDFLKNIVGKNNIINTYVGDINSVIPGFEEEDFLAWAEDRFGKFQKSWNKGAVEELHPFETEKLFEMQNLYFSEAKQKGFEMGMDTVSVKDSKIIDFFDKKDRYEIVVQVNGSVKGNIGEQTKEECQYYLSFEKEKHGRSLTVCPCCTAPVDANAAHCVYCHTNFPNAMDQWLLAKIDKI